MAIYRNIFQIRNIVITLIGSILVIIAIVTVATAIEFGQLIEKKLPKDCGRNPAGIYARPLKLFEGAEILPDDFIQELVLLGYRNQKDADTAGSFTQKGEVIELFTRQFQFADKYVPARKIRIQIKENRVASVTNRQSGQPISDFQLEPVMIDGSLYPGHKAYGYLRIDDTPPLLYQTIIAIEDREFFSHPGVDFSALLRALIVNLRTNSITQGGSTITQQLARNLFLSSETTLKRKIKEIVLSLLLELKLSKTEILESYINHVYLGQNGKHEIRGFSTASMYYFGRNVRDLKLNETALLVGILKGPSYYNPIKFPDRAKSRRNTVLKRIADLSLINEGNADRAIRSTVSTIKRTKDKIHFPAFIDLVKRRLLADHRIDFKPSENNCRNGVRVFTTCDPIIQLKVEKAVAAELDRIDSRYQIEKTELETGVVIITPHGGDVLSVIGGRSFRFQGFNRAADVNRSIGSLIKPVYFLAALERPKQYNFMTLLDNSELSMEGDDGIGWKPENHMKVFNCEMPLYQVLSFSLNTASVRMGMELGLEEVRTTLQRVGFEREVTLYPSSLLGTVPMSPIEVAKIYHTFSAGGLTSKLRLIESVCSLDGSLLVQNEPILPRRFDAAPVYLLNVILQKVISEGTAGLRAGQYTKRLLAAGKTGTTDDQRDSWFAGFTGDKLGVVWLGRDDYQPSPITGAEGAFKVWEKIMAEISCKPFKPEKPEKVRWVQIDPGTGSVIKESACETAISLPYIAGYEPAKTILCIEAESVDTEEIFVDWLKDVMN